VEVAIIEQTVIWHRGSFSELPPRLVEALSEHWRSVPCCVPIIAAHQDVHLIVMWHVSVELAKCWEARWGCKWEALQELGGVELGRIDRARVGGS
jgi:hypothetical protein